MKKAQIAKPASPKSANLVKVAEPIKVKNVNPKQAIQGEMGKAQGYLGKFAGQHLKETMLKQDKPKKKGAK